MARGGGGGLLRSSEAGAETVAVAGDGTRGAAE